MMLSILCSTCKPSILSMTNILLILLANQNFWVTLIWQGPDITAQHLSHAWLEVQQHTGTVLLHAADSAVITDGIGGHRRLPRAQQTPAVDPPEFVRRPRALVYEYSADRAPILSAQLYPAAAQARSPHYALLGARIFCVRCCKEA